MPINIGPANTGAVGGIRIGDALGVSEVYVGTDLVWTAEVPVEQLSDKDLLSEDRLGFGFHVTLWDANSSFNSLEWGLPAGTTNAGSTDSVIGFFNDGEDHATTAPFLTLTATDGGSADHNLGFINAPKHNVDRSLTDAEVNQILAIAGTNITPADLTAAGAAFGIDDDHFEIYTGTTTFPPPQIPVTLTSFFLTEDISGGYAGGIIQFAIVGIPGSAWTVTETVTSSVATGTLSAGGTSTAFFTIPSTPTERTLTFTLSSPPTGSIDPGVATDITVTQTAFSSPPSAGIGMGLVPLDVGSLYVYRSNSGVSGSTNYPITSGVNAGFGGWFPAYGTRETIAPGNNFFLGAGTNGRLGQVAIGVNPSVLPVSPKYRLSGSSGAFTDATVVAANSFAASAGGQFLGSIYLQAPPTSGLYEFVITADNGTEGVREILVGSTTTQTFTSVITVQATGTASLFDFSGLGYLPGSSNSAAETASLYLGPTSINTAHDTSVVFENFTDLSNVSITASTGLTVEFAQENLEAPEDSTIIYLTLRGVASQLGPGPHSIVVNERASTEGAPIIRNYVPLTGGPFSFLVASIGGSPITSLTINEGVSGISVLYSHPNPTTLVAGDIVTGTVGGAQTRVVATNDQGTFETLSRLKE